jgi:two-component system sensor histidine kinase YesM
MLQGVWQRWGFQARLLLSILMVLAVTIAASGMLFYLSSAATIESQTLALTSNTVSQMARSVDLYVENIGRLSRSISNDTSVQRALRVSDPAASVPRQPDDSFAVDYRLLTLATSWPSIQGIYLYANDGALFYFTRGQGPRHSISAADEPWAARMRQQAAPPVLLWPTAPETTVPAGGELVFSYIHLVKNTDTGRRIGYLKIDIDVSVMDDLLALADRAAQGRQVLLVDDGGHVIYDNTAALTSRQLDDLSPIGAPRAQGRLEWRGSAYLYTTQRSGYTSWRVWLLTPTELISSETRQAGLLVLTLCVGAMMLLSIIIYVVTKRVTRPLHLMAQTMARVEHGDLSVRVPPTPAPHELGRLSRDFNSMLESLERLITQVYQAQLREKDAQLLALQAQINPHFLFNTLNSMRALSRKGAAEAVSTMAESLADLFRYSMSNWNELVPLHEELKHVENYVTIQKARFGERICYRCAAPDALQDALVVKLSLQPLVENAIAHGLSRRADRLSITVDASHEAGRLAITVTDDGGGIEPATLLRLQEALARPVAAGELPTADVGIGVINIDRRVKLLFGEQYGLRFQVNHHVGTTVVVDLPFQSRGGYRELEAQGREDSRGGG